MGREFYEDSKAFGQSRLFVDFPNILFQVCWFGKRRYVLGKLTSYQSMLPYLSI
jgi:hypothetical protein